MSDDLDSRRPVITPFLAALIMSTGSLSGFNAAMAGDMTQPPAMKSAAQAHPVTENTAETQDPDCRSIEKSNIRRGHVRKQAESEDDKTDSGNALKARGANEAAPRRLGDPVPGTDARDDW